MGFREMRVLLTTYGAWMIAAAGWMAPSAAAAAAGANDAFAAMRVDAVSPPLPAAHLALRAIDGTAIRLADYKGKVVVIGFLLTN